MTQNWDELHELQERIAKLSPEDQLYLVERILRKIRDRHFTDHEALRESMHQQIEDLMAHEAPQ